MIKVENVSAVLGGQSILDNISFTVNDRNAFAITGGSGSGKTSLAKAIAGNLFHSGSVSFDGFGRSVNIAFIPQEHQFKNLSNTSQFYYQQRFNASESDQSQKVSDLLAKDSRWIGALKLDHVYDRPLLQLSNGENKRLQLAQRLAENPDILILDNPFLGLDVSGRQILQEVLSALIGEGVQVILISTSTSLPEFIKDVLFLDKGRLIFFGSKEAFVNNKELADHHPEAFDRSLLSSLKPAATAGFNLAVDINNVHIRYDEKLVLDDVSWQVKRGECWSLSGPNGAGKSTLLSLITADNPQAYANDISLFDRRRGTGESIWDIKKNIGYVSPELHLYFDQGSTCGEVIASGLFDTIGLFRGLSDMQQALVNTWIAVLRLHPCRNKPLRTMSRGEQRLALLGRALIKNPALLVLDEPCQGLDEFQTRSFASLIDAVHSEFGTTVIYVSHFVQDIPSCVTNFIRLENGKRVDDHLPINTIRI